MDRRSFLKTTSTALAAFAMPNTSAHAAEPAAQGRLILPMNGGWRYIPHKVEAAHALSFDDSQFERIVLPHANTRVPWHNFDDARYEFVSTYRRTFRTPSAARGKRVFIDFEGAMTASTVWINGDLLGEYKGGYTPFSFELTPHLHSSGNNVLVVHLDSTERSDIPPFGDMVDYLTFGGIYREVTLRIVPATWIDNIFVRPTNVLSPKPSLEVDCFLAGTAAEGLVLEAQLFYEGKPIAHTTQAAAHSPAPDADASADPKHPAPVHASTESIHDPARHTIAFELWTTSSYGTSTTPTSIPSMSA
jgi:beta-galactosidase